VIRAVDHIGIAVRSIEERLSLYRTLGLKVARSEEVPSEKVRVAFLPVGDTRVELLEPTTPDSPVARFLEKRGEGLHHICFVVEDIRGAMKALAALGFELLSEEPRAGAHGSLVCFLHPRSAGGVLIELSQPGG
jgi:methylmalonyl-CoA/ethylmalonyl-CoA epimerase